jgi:hypothetical protein
LHRVYGDNPAVSNKNKNSSTKKNNFKNWAVALQPKYFSIIKNKIYYSLANLFPQSDSIFKLNWF